MTSWGNVPGVVELPDGRRVRGAGVRSSRRDVPPPHFIVYLLGKEPTVAHVEYRWVKWRDFWVPSSTSDAVSALAEAYTRATIERVEIACGGGIGRTGTALALLAVIAGVPQTDSVAWIRERYHPRAVETRGQRKWIEGRDLDIARLRGLP